MSDQKLAVDSGHWLLYRYNPERSLAGENPLMLDSRTPTKRVKEFLQQQTRFQMLAKSAPEDAKRLWALAQHDSEIRYRMYEYLAQRNNEQPSKTDPKGKTTKTTKTSSSKTDSKGKTTKTTKTKTNKDPKDATNK